MSIAIGSRLGPYEILALLGAGGMGEVYRARDIRLDRTVALKVLPEEFFEDRERVARFEREAKLLAALNHPGIAAIYSFEEVSGLPGEAASSGRHVLAMELLEGETLRERLRDGALPARKALDIAVQVARGLAAAHEKGILHRDLKPENLFVTADGRLKILDFGLARRALPATDRGDTRSPTLVPATEPGLVLGTAGYMSPEQVRGRPVDARSDLFAFGAILYEMLTGQRAFRGSSSIETMNAILNAEPAGFSDTFPAMPVGLERIVRHCLEKSPGERFQSASDLAFALEALSGDSTRSGAVVPARVSRRPSAAGAAAIIGLAAMAAVGYWVGTARGRSRPPTFRQLTFRRGTILTARFSRDGATIVYGAAWDGEPFRIFTVRPESPETSAIALPPADLLAVSSTGELALGLDRLFYYGWMSSGTLARAPLAGGTPRELLEAVQDADWSPDGSSLAVVRRVAGRHRLEFPAGAVLHESPGWISHSRISPDGSRIAFVEHPIFGDDRGAVAVVDRLGKNLKMLSPVWASVQGLAWTHDGREVWFTASEKGFNAGLHAASLSGSVRDVLHAPGRMTLLDISRDGRVLLSRDQSRSLVMVRAPGESVERDLSWLDSSSAQDLSRDGRGLLFGESGEGGGPEYGVYFRKTDGSPALRLGDGQALALSPDGRWALAMRVGAPSQLRLLPTGTGESKLLARGPIEGYHWGRFLGDGKRILFTANEPGKALRIYMQERDDPKPRPVTPEGVGYLLPPTPDGKFLVSSGPKGGVFLYPLDGGEPKPLEGVEPGEVPLRWADAGQTLFVMHRLGVQGARVDRLDRASGRRALWKEIGPPDRTGVVGFGPVVLSEDGTSYAYTYHRVLSELYVVDGLK